MTAIRTALLTDQRKVLDTLADAFFDDPVHAWIFEDTAVRTAELPTWFRHLIDMVPVGGHVDVADDLSSAAVWHPPAPMHGPPQDVGEMPDQLPPIAQHLLAVLDPEAAIDKLTRLAVVMDKHPPEPHWYLAVLGSSSEVRGKGQGSDLLQRQLDICDATATAAYLESSNPRNVPLYARHGFEVMETVHLAAGGPEMTFMWREARS
ncbi:MAG: GNAT family N-acetyltransferase [Acidimicrobiia bacterium]|nr:GNAT family N-acetyltransferase [Acidimicrobiia bacterium]MDH5236175.1 GNAT family N-acetyltransferase [Acidimicrobiia bacterium]